MSKQVFNNSIYKDEAPLKTIHRIRGVLTENGILTKEVSWKNSLDKFYSCRVEMDGTTIGTNGKGLTAEYALASAYGEFMERFQNNILFDEHPFTPEAMEKNGFEAFSDEKIISMGDAIPLPECFKKAKMHYGDGISIYDFWEEYRKNHPENKEMLLPYYNAGKGRIELLPYERIMRTYGSNGMCGGNSREESICQGLGEVFERYAIREIFYQELTPPTIPIEYIDKVGKKQADLVRAMEMDGKYRVIVKDASLGKGLPVIAIIVVHPASNKYAVIFGSDTDPLYALERCLTEVLQGSSLDEFNKMQPISFKAFSTTEEKNNNFEQITINAMGRFPAAFFGDKPDYEFRGFNRIQFSSMKEKLDYSMEIAGNIGFDDIYIRDCSIMGFSSHQIIIPGCSESCWSDENRRMENTPVTEGIMQFDVLESIVNMKHLSNDQLLILAKSMENYHPAGEKLKHSSNTMLNEYFPISIKNNKAWDKITLEFVLSLIYYRTGQYLKAYDKLGVYIEFVLSQKETADVGYHVCAKEYIALKAQSWDEKKIVGTLSNLFKPELVEEVASDISDQEKVLDYLPLPNCHDCENCHLAPNCSYSIMEKYYLTYKDCAARSAINQEDLAELFADFKAKH